METEFPRPTQGLLMPRIQIELELPEPLAAELKAAAEESHCSPARFTRETLEAALAERRLPRVRLELMTARASRMAETREL
jgi:hypothetical protein